MPGFVGQAPNGFSDRAKGRGVVSSSWLAQVGKGGALSAGGGNIGSYTNVTGAGNGADTTADTIGSIIIPANTLDIAGRCITLQAFGTVSLTSATKTVAFAFGSSITQSIVQYTTTNGGTWQAWIQIFKTASNVQMALIQADASGTTSTLLGVSGAGRQVVLNTSGTETDTAAITMKITGQSSVATANLVICNGFITDAFN